MDGSVTLFLENEQHTLLKGDIYIINRYQIHSFVSCSRSPLILAFQIHSGLYRSISRRLTFVQFDSIVKDEALHEEISAVMTGCAELYFENEDFRGVECSSLVLHLLGLLLSRHPYVIADEREHRTALANTQRINRVTDYIAAHFNEKISLEDIAALEGITTYHASHFIKKTFGISFQEYLNTVRFEHAMQLLLQTDLSLLDICLESSFSSSRYLIKMTEKNSAAAHGSSEKALNARPFPQPDFLFPIFRCAILLKDLPAISQSCRDYPHLKARFPKDAVFRQMLSVSVSFLRSADSARFPEDRYTWLKRSFFRSVILSALYIEKNAGNIDLSIFPAAPKTEPHRASQPLRAVFGHAAA